MENRTWRKQINKKTDILFSWICAVQQHSLIYNTTEHFLDWVTTIGFPFGLRIRSKVFPAKMGGAHLMEFRGQHDHVGELREAVQCTTWCREQCDKENVTLIDTVVFQHTHSSNSRSSSLYLTQYWFLTQEWQDHIGWHPAAAHAAWHC